MSIYIEHYLWWRAEFLSAINHIMVVFCLFSHPLTTTSPPPCPRPYSQHCQFRPSTRTRAPPLCWGMWAPFTSLWLPQKRVWAPAPPLSRGMWAALLSFDRGSGEGGRQGTHEVWEAWWWVTKHEPQHLSWFVFSHSASFTHANNISTQQHGPRTFTMLTAVTMLMQTTPAPTTATTMRATVTTMTWAAAATTMVTTPTKVHHHLICLCTGSKYSSPGIPPVQGEGHWGEAEGVGTGQHLDHPNTTWSTTTPMRTVNADHPNTTWSTSTSTQTWMVNMKKRAEGWGSEGQKWWGGGQGEERGNNMEQGVQGQGEEADPPQGCSPTQHDKVEEDGVTKTQDEEAEVCRLNPTRRGVDDACNPNTTQPVHDKEEEDRHPNTTRQVRSGAELLCSMFFFFFVVFSSQNKAKGEVSLGSSQYITQFLNVSVWKKYWCMIYVRVAYTGEILWCHFTMVYMSMGEPKKQLLSLTCTSSDAFFWGTPDLKLGPTECWLFELPHPIVTLSQLFNSHFICVLKSYSDTFSQ